MAQLILKYNASDPKQVLAYQKNDIIEVLDDGVFAGKEVTLENGFLIVMAKGTAKELGHLKAIQYSPVLDPSGRKIITKKRANFFDFEAKMSASDLTAIRNSKEILLKEVSLSDIGAKA